MFLLAFPLEVIRRGNTIKLGTFRAAQHYRVLTLSVQIATRKAPLKQLEFQCLACRVCVFPGASEPSRELRRAEALGGAPVLPAGQPQVQSHLGAAFPRLLLQSGRDAPQVRTMTNSAYNCIYSDIKYVVLD